MKAVSYTHLAGCVDSALNNYVSIHYNATVMSFLQCFYGVGVMVSPYIMSVVINSAEMCIRDRCLILN